jgi:hypothetical protein
VKDFREFRNHRGPGEKGRRMLGHALVHVSRSFENSGIEGFVLSPVRIHENEYTSYVRICV